MSAIKSEVEAEENTTYLSWQDLILIISTSHDVKAPTLVASINDRTAMVHREVIMVNTPHHTGVDVTVDIVVRAME